MCDHNIAVKDCFIVATVASPRWNSFQAVSALFHKAAVQEIPLPTHQRIHSTGSSPGLQALLSLLWLHSAPGLLCILYRMLLICIRKEVSREPTSSPTAVFHPPPPAKCLGFFAAPFASFFFFLIFKSFHET